MSFPQFYEKYKTLVFNLALRYTGIMEEAEEITQDVFVAAHRHLDKFRGESDVNTWLYRITLNRCHDWSRSRSRKKRSFIQRWLNANDEPEPGHWNHPGVQLEEKEELRVLMSCIQGLPEKQKTALLLLKAEGKSQKEAAMIMDISEKALESLFQRAKSGLKKKLNNTKE